MYISFIFFPVFWKVSLPCVCMFEIEPRILHVLDKQSIPALFVYTSILRQTLTKFPRLNLNSFCSPTKP